AFGSFRFRNIATSQLKSLGVLAVAPFLCPERVGAAAARCRTLPFHARHNLRQRTSVGWQGSDGLWQGNATKFDPNGKPLSPITTGYAGALLFPYVIRKGLALERPG